MNKCRFFLLCFTNRLEIMFDLHPQEKSEAVVVEGTGHSRRVEITAGLFHPSFDVDAAIEPKCIFWDEYVSHDKANILPRP
jgi:hypothetical protein